jgi:hypothetical protein
LYTDRFQHTRLRVLLLVKHFSKRINNITNSFKIVINNVRKAVNNDRKIIKGVRRIIKSIRRVILSFKEIIFVFNKFTEIGAFLIIKGSGGKTLACYLLPPFEIFFIRVYSGLILPFYTCFFFITVLPYKKHKKPGGTMDFPGVEMGVDGVRFINKRVESSGKGAVWVNY